MGFILEKMGMDYEECIDKGLLRKREDAKNWANKEIKIARKFIKQAKQIILTGAYESTEMIAYTSVFHSARALLYFHGVTERSHYCIFVALLHFYSNDHDFYEMVKTADMMRRGREETSYGGKIVYKEEAEFSVKFADSFLRAVKKKLKM